MPRTKKSVSILTAQQRRRQIIELLAGYLARMPEAIDIPPSRPGSPPDSEHESDLKNLQERTQKSLELAVT